MSQHCVIENENYSPKTDRLRNQWVPVIEIFNVFGSVTGVIKPRCRDDWSRVALGVIANTSCRVST